MAEKWQDEMRRLVAVVGAYPWKGGTMSPWWDVLADAEAHLKGERAICNRGEVLEMLRKGERTILDRGTSP